MKLLTNRKFNKMMKRLDDMEKTAKKHIRGDAFIDPDTSRGSTIDKTQRLVGRSTINADSRNLEYYISNGFVQNVVDIPAEDSTREWIDITTNLDAENEEINYSEMILDRMEELDIQEKITDLIRYARIYSRGSFLYYSVKANTPQEGEELKKTLPEEISTIEFINVIDRPSNVSIINLNPSDPTKKDYNSIQVTIGGNIIHPSRYNWLVHSFIPERLAGISPIQTIQDAIVAQDNGLWSVATILNTMALNIFKSDEIADLSPEQKGELLAKIKHLLITMSAIALKSDESLEQITLNATGMKEIFDFIFDNLCGLARIPKNILLGKAHGVVTAGEYDTLNYYANIARFQKITLRPIIEKIIDLIVKEQNGEIYKELDGQTEDLEVDFTFNSLWELDPVAQSEVDLKFAQRDQIDITVGKTGPEEARQLDPRYANLDPFIMDRKALPDMTEPGIKKPDDDDELEVPDGKKTDE